MRVISRIQCVYSYLPPTILDAVKALPKQELNEVREIRLRLGRKLTVTTGTSEFYLHRGGVLSHLPDNAANVTKSDLNYIFRLALRDSVHSYQREITRGYVTVQGGCRIGFCGTAVLDPRLGYETENIKDISCINIRIAREIKGCADEIFRTCFDQTRTSLLIAGPPSSGKTTILRDLTRILGERVTVSLIDDRNEIASVYDGTAQNDIGTMTDVFTSYSRYDGIITAVRVMSPVYLICDEIGCKTDFNALEYAVNSGVKLIASCHCESLEQLRSKRYIRRLIKLGSFDKAVMLGSGSLCGKVTCMRKAADCIRDKCLC